MEELAFSENNSIWENYRYQLYTFVVRRVADHNAAEDIVQDILTKVYLHLPNLTSQEKFLAWLYQIARNAIIDYYRRTKPEAELSTSFVVEDLEHSPSNYQQLAPCMLPLIKQLDSPYREALIWSEIEGLTQREIAHKVGISLSGMKSRVQRGRKMLKAILLACCDLHFDQHGKLVDYILNTDCQSCQPG